MAKRLVMVLTHGTPVEHYFCMNELLEYKIWRTKLKIAEMATQGKNAHVHLVLSENPDLTNGNRSGVRLQPFFCGDAPETHRKGRAQEVHISDAGIRERIRAARCKCGLKN